MMRPVMSAEMSTEVLGSILPLAVTALTRSRRPTCSMRTSTPACFFCWILKPAKPPPASTRMPRRQSDLHPTRHVRPSLAEWAADRGLQRRDGLVIVVHRVHVVALGLLHRVLRIGRPRARCPRRAGSGPAPGGAGREPRRGWPAGPRWPGRRSTGPGSGRARRSAPGAGAPGRSRPRPPPRPAPALSRSERPKPVKIGSESRQIGLERLVGVVEGEDVVAASRICWPPGRQRGAGVVEPDAPKQSGPPPRLSAVLTWLLYWHRRRCDWRIAERWLTSRSRW